MKIIFFIIHLFLLSLVLSCNENDNLKINLNEREITKMTKAVFILYVSDQDSSTEFYSNVLDQKPSLYVPGMTEFILNNGSSLGLMPVSGIKKLLGNQLPDPNKAFGIPKSEVYLFVDDPASYHNRALKNNAKELSPLQERNWGDVVAYSLDPDGHVLAFAKGMQ